MSQQKHLITHELRKQCDDCMEFLCNNLAPTQAVSKPLNNIYEALDKIEHLQAHLDDDEWSVSSVFPLKLCASMSSKQLLLYTFFLALAVYSWSEKLIVTATVAMAVAIFFLAKYARKGYTEESSQTLIRELSDSYSEAEAQLTRLCDTLVLMGKQETFQNMNANGLKLHQLVTLHLTLSGLLAGLATAGELIRLVSQNTMVLHKEKDAEEKLAQMSTTDTVEECGPNEEAL